MALYSCLILLVLGLFWWHLQQSIYCWGLIYNISFVNILYICVGGPYIHLLSPIICSSMWFQARFLISIYMTIDAFSGKALSLVYIQFIVFNIKERGFFFDNM